MAREGAEGAKAAFRTQQAFAIAQATIAAYQAAVGVRAAMSFLPPPIPGLAAAATLTAGMATVAQIASQQPPTVERHMGESMRGARDPLAPDERRVGGITALSQEASTPGGILSSAGVNALNAGRTSQASSSAPAAPWKHLGREFGRRMRSGDGRLARGVNRAARNQSIPSGRRGW
jgi:hypothetical protein